MRTRLKSSPQDVTAIRLREVVNYDPATGVFTWAKTGRGINFGAACGKLKDGYRRICIDGRSYQASRLAWFWVHGEWPLRMIRFRDENRDNSAIGNLEFGATDWTDAESQNAYHRKYRGDRPEKQRQKRLKLNFGISLEQYQEMLVAQKGVCACCGQPETATQNGKLLFLCVDHDHKDHGIRGLLCQHCNKMLGHAKDSETTLATAIEYLRTYRAKPKTNVIPLSGRRIANTKS